MSVSGVLKRSSKPGVDFEALTGREFRIMIVPMDEGNIRLKEATYAGVTKAGPQVAFQVVPGRSALTTVYTAARNGELGTLVQAGEVSAPLRGIRYTSSRMRRYVVEGVQ